MMITKDKKPIRTIWLVLFKADMLQLQIMQFEGKAATFCVIQDGIPRTNFSTF